MQVEEFTELLLTTSRNPVVILDSELLVVETNYKLHPNFSLLDSQSVGKSFYEIADSVWKSPEMEKLLTGILPEAKSINQHPISISYKDQKTELLISGRYYLNSADNKNYILLILDTKNLNESSSINDFSLQELSNTALLTSIQRSTFYGVAIYEPIFSDDEVITDFRILFTSAEVPGNFGLTREAVVGRKCSEVFAGIFENGTFEKMAECFNSGNSTDYEVEVLQGESSMWLCAEIEKSNGTITITSKNCTQEKQTAARLLNTNNLLNATNKKFEQLILNEFSASFSSAETGKNFFDLLLNEIALKTGVDFAFVAEVEHQDDGDVMHSLSFNIDGKIVENFHYSLADSICNETMKGDECVFLSGVRTLFPNNFKVGDLKVEGYIGLTLRDLKGHGVGVICVMHRSEIGDSEYIMSLLRIAAKRCEIELARQRSEKLLEQKNFELERQNKDLASFTYIASHDLQEPLRKIRMFNSRLLDTDSKTLSERGKSYVNSITSTADRMQKLINALLSYSSMDSDDLSRERTNLNVLLKDVMSMMDDILEEKDVSIESDELPSLPVIPLQFQQLLYNILSNAIKYSKVNVPCKIKISASKEFIGQKHYWRLDIADNGIGFDSQYKDKIFEVFQRLHGKQEYAGTGVGLAICAKIVKNHHGMISAVGIPGEGSTFSIFIPEK